MSGRSAMRGSPSSVAAGTTACRRLSLPAMGFQPTALKAESLERPGFDAIQMNSGLEAVLHPEERRHLVAQSVFVQLEEQVQIEEQASQHIGLHADRTAQRIERILRERDVGKCRPAI